LLTVCAIWSCDTEPVVRSTQNAPVITALTLHYSELNRSLFIAADVEDAQGWENIDSVTFSLYQISTATYLTGTLFLEGNLLDDGPPRDIIIRDGVFSYLIDSTELGNYEGYYRVYAAAYDADGHVSDTVTVTELVQANSAPELYLLSAPTSFEKWDTLKFYFRVTDLQGYDDIASVPYSIRRPDGQFFDRYFSLKDDGTGGDEVANDGIFSIFQPSNPESKYQGLYYFYFFAEDYSGAISDTITLKITNPGVHITAPATAQTVHFGDNLEITWESAYITRVQVEYSLNANESSPDWVSADTVVAALGKYNWTVPSVQSTNYCKVRVSDLTYPRRSDVNDSYLVIAP